jgi:hypothetical protein
MQITSENIKRFLLIVESTVPEKVTSDNLVTYYNILDFQKKRMHYISEPMGPGQTFTSEQILGEHSPDLTYTGIIDIFELYENSYITAENFNKFYSDLIQEMRDICWCSACTYDPIWAHSAEEVAAIINARRLLEIDHLD